MGPPLTITLPTTGLSRSDYRDLMGASPLPLAVIDRSGDIVEANRAFAALLDTTMARLRDQRLADLTHPDDRPALELTLEALLLTSSRSGTITIRLLAAADGREPEPVPVKAHLSATGADGTTHLLFAAVDLRAPALAPGLLEHAATHDPLTGLLNRAGLMAELQQLLDDGRPASLALLDLDTLGPVDDAYGHAGGDHLLRRVADALTDLTSPDGLAGRLAGDEFVVIADTDDDQALGRFLTQELARVQVEVAPGIVLAAKPSVGTASVQAGLTPSQVLAHADDEMYAVKQRRQDALSRV
jgi:diguanylate cyclase (GGDEF)-like protein/PAS domain S-box-containing protein